MPLYGMSSKPIYDDWDMKVYAQCLSMFTGAPLEQINPKGNQVHTWMIDAEGRPLHLDIRKYRWRDAP